MFYFHMLNILLSTKTNDNNTSESLSYSIIYKRETQKGVQKSPKSRGGEFDISWKLMGPFCII